MTRIAVLGAGGWGKNLVRVFCELLGADRVTVCDPSAERRDAMRDAHAGVRVTRENSYDHADGVVVAAPATAHFELAMAAIHADKHVLVEKPMTLSSSEAEALIELADRKQRILMVDHLLEYHPAVGVLRELVQQGELGRVHHMTSQRLNLGVVRQEENAWWSLAPHDISIMLDLLREEPIDITARGEVYLQEGIEDITHATLTFPSGVMGHIHTSWLDPVKVRRLTVVGDRCMAVFDDMAEQKLVLYRHRLDADADGRYRTQRGTAEAVDVPASEPLQSMAEEFLRSMDTGSAPRSDGWDGLRVVRVLEKAQRSIEEGQRNA